MTVLFSVIHPLTFKLLIQVIACDNGLTTTYVSAGDVVIFAGVGAYLNHRPPPAGITCGSNF